MSWTDLEYALIKFHQLHQYDAYANPDKVGLGRCGCGVDMFYCQHDEHCAKALIAELGLTAEFRTVDDLTQVRVVGQWENTPWPSLQKIVERIKEGRRAG